MALELESQGLFAERGVPVLYTGIGKVKDKVVVMLDAAKVMSPGDSSTVASALTSAEAGPASLAHAA